MFVCNQAVTCEDWTHIWGVISTRRFYGGWSVGHVVLSRAFDGVTGGRPPHGNGRRGGAATGHIEDISEWNWNIQTAPLLFMSQALNSAGWYPTRNASRDQIR